MEMENSRAEEIMQSHGVINVSYNGMPVWIESIRGDTAEVTLLDADQSIDVSISALTEADPIKSL